MGQILTHRKKYFCKKKKKKKKIKNKIKNLLSQFSTTSWKKRSTGSPFSNSGFQIYNTYASYPLIRTSACAYQEVNVDFSKNLYVVTVQYSLSLTT